MFQFTQIQCLYKVTIVYVQSQVSSSYSDFSRDLYILQRKKTLVWLAECFVCLFERARGLYPMTHSTHGSQTISLCSLSFSPILSLCPVSLLKLFSFSLLCTSHLRSGFTLTWFDFQWTNTLHSISLHLLLSVYLFS